MTSQTIVEGVRKILENYPKARDSYNWLWYLYMREVLGIPIYVPYQVLDGKKKIPSVESITRACRKIQNDEQVLKPSVEVQIARSINEGRVSEWATKGHKNTVSQYNAGGFY